MRFLITSFLIHIIVFSFVWVGLSTPAGSEQNTLTYLGGAFTEAKGSSRPNADHLIIEESSPTLFKPWLKMRELNKPR
jgi:hypothetical protein